MARVQITPWWWAAGGAVALGLVALGSRGSLPSPLGWLAGVGYLIVSTALVSRGLARDRMPRFGPANAATATRSALVGIVTALVVTSFTDAAPAWLLVALTAPALALDAVDGFLARRTRTESALGARFDMEVDAFLLLVLSVYLGGSLGWWVVAIGGMRYAFVAAGWALPWLRAQLPPRYWRKVVTAVCGIALTVAASGLLPPALSTGAVVIALALLVESFGRDVVFLIGARSPRLAARGRRADA